jgi:membrane associated rhomboid family serine protease
MSIFRDLQQGARRSGTPGTVVLVAAIVGCFVVTWLTQGKYFGEDLAFLPSVATSKPWTLILYPFASSVAGFVGVLFSAWWLWGIGGSVERDLNTPRYVGFFFLIALLGALAHWFGAVLMNSEQALFGSFLPIAAVTVVWGTRNPDAIIQFMMVIPIPGKWLAWISGLMVFFSTSPQLALFACTPLVLAWAFAADKLPIPYRAVQRSRRVPGGRGAPTDPRYFDDVRKREKQREERERLRKLFESSLSDDENKDR